ncbi:MarR family winged helix-turn-helix transcriptional regulator [Geodermatophilus nigrescens]|uniref:MarR family winged helix-turn-helix transcriptional regulator n=1 Tax=Geodermatophilus TaxID=1860 RepID=UPI001C315CCD|nr:MarR family winged helix-turn-helix transcriptional regulator [Geodermatophilus nigrescens]
MTATEDDASPASVHSALSGDLTWLVQRVGSGLVGAMDHVARVHGGSLRSVVVLRLLAACPPATQLALGSSAGLDKTTVTSALDALERAGWAVRRPSAHDRRVRLAEITDAGREWLAAVEPELTRVEDELLADLPAADREHLVRTLHRLAAGRFASAAPPAGSCV